MPTRLVKIEGDADDLRARLVVSKEHRDCEHYAALSYRWSRNRQHITLRNYVEAYADNIPLGNLPATLLDAIGITHALGLQYIWIDCLCIIQDSLRDWELECEQMSNIFANATVTLAASSAAHADHGMLRSRSPLIGSSYCYLTFRDVSGFPSGRVKVMYARESFEGSRLIQPLRRPPLDDRGWTLQERILSTRVLSFEDDKMWWDCTSCRRIESSHGCIFSEGMEFEGPDIAKQPLLKLSHLQMYDRWLMTVDDFCTRQLTYCEDALPAIAGIASIVSRVTNDNYLAGLWQRDLGRGLMWCSGDADDDRRPDDQSDPDAPSWSWARAHRGLSRPSYSVTEYDEVESLVTFVSARIQTAGANLFGRVLPGGALTIQAKVRPALIRWRGSKLGNMRWEVTDYYDQRIRIALDKDKAASTSDIKDGLNILAVMICKALYGEKQSLGLALQLADDGVNYRRIGTISHWGIYNRKPYPTSIYTPLETFFHYAEVKTISMI